MRPTVAFVITLFETVLEDFACPLGNRLDTVVGPYKTGAFERGTLAPNSGSILDLRVATRQARVVQNWFAEFRDRQQD